MSRTPEFCFNFGVPTMFMAGEMYFVQDRLDFVEEALRD